MGLYTGENKGDKTMTDTPICPSCGKSETLATGIGYFCETCPPSLPKEWVGLFSSYKSDAKEYWLALQKIKHIAMVYTDSDDAMEKIEAVINGVFE